MNIIHPMPSVLIFERSMGISNIGLLIVMKKHQEAA